MSLNLRLMHVKPNGVNRVWDVILLDQRQNARIHLNEAGTEFMDVVIMGGEHHHPKNIAPKREYKQTYRKVRQARRKRPRRLKKVLRAVK